MLKLSTATTAIHCPHSHCLINNRVRPNSCKISKKMMPRRPPQALPPGNATCCPGKLFIATNNDEESEQEDVSTEPKKKRQLGIMSFYEKKPKKGGQGHPWKVVPPPQPAKKQKVEEAKTGHWNKYSDYSNPAVAATWQEEVEFLSPQVANFQLMEMLC